MFIRAVERLFLNETLYVSSKFKYIRIYRWNPYLNSNPWFNIFPLKFEKNKKWIMVLDLLFKIKNEFDATLTFRRSCREGICGSCSMNIDGVNSLACLKMVQIKNLSFLTVYPLPHMFIMKDLVSDLTNFYNQHRLIKPWLINNQKTNNFEKKNLPIKTFQLQREFLQSKLDRIELDGLYECILCACCSSSCPSYWWNYDKYLGPAILLQAYRWVIDSRDLLTVKRLNFLNNKLRVTKCHSIFNCVKVCPKKLNPTKAINFLKYYIAVI